MRKQTMEDLAKLYGVEINETDPGKGGLFYEDIEGNKIQVDDIFESEDYMGLKKERVSLEKCYIYSTYGPIASLMLNAA